MSGCIHNLSDKLSIFSNPTNTFAGEKHLIVGVELIAF